MTTIQAWQHIYSNVEKEQSPKNRGGFQTLFYSLDGLNADEVSEMEGRLLYFPSKTAEPVKRVFFTTTTGKVVIGQIVVLPDPDQFGRKGRYLAHALAFNKADLHDIDMDPFCVFHSFTFFNTVDQALSQGDFAKGHIPPAWVNVAGKAGSESQAAAHWSASELSKLALLALRVDQQTAQREAITVAGTEAEIETAIQAAFLAVPTTMRSRCTFDTYFYRCNLVATFYWAIGLPEVPASIKFVVVDGSARQVQGAVPTQPETAFERWAVAALEKKKFDRLAQSRDQAFAVSEWLEGRPYDRALLDTATPHIVEEVFEVNPAPVQAALRGALTQQLPETLINRAVDRIYDHASPQECYHHLRQGFTMSQLLTILYEAYEAQAFIDPGRAEVKALEQLLIDDKHGLLQLFVAYWRNDRRNLAAVLTEATDADYRHFGQIALGSEFVKPLSLLVPGKADAFLDVYLRHGVDDWVNLVSALIDAGQTASLSRLTTYVSALPRKTLNALDRLVAETPDTPPDFSASVATAIAALPLEESFVKGILKSARGWLPGTDKDK